MMQVDVFCENVAKFKVTRLGVMPTQGGISQQIFFCALHAVCTDLNVWPLIAKKQK